MIVVTFAHSRCRIQQPMCRRLHPRRKLRYLPTQILDGKHSEESTIDGGKWRIGSLSKDCYTRGMFSRAAFAICLAGSGPIALLACSGSSPSGNGPSGSSPEDCPIICEGMRPTGPHIDLAPSGAAIAAIETLAAQSASYGAEVCNVSWSELSTSLAAQADPVCPAQAMDAGWVADACAKHYSCLATGHPLDGGSGCAQAWIDLSAEHCLVTVISTTGERQSFEVRRSDLVSYSCHTGDGQCVERGSYPVSPSEITITFASPDGGA